MILCDGMCRRGDGVESQREPPAPQNKSYPTTTGKVLRARPPVRRLPFFPMLPLLDWSGLGAKSGALRTQTVLDVGH
jgi:hypothetical protein